MHHDRSSEPFHQRPDVDSREQRYFDANGFDVQVRLLTQMEFGVVANLNILQEMQAVKREDSRFVGIQLNTLLVQLLDITQSLRLNMIDILQHVQQQAALRAIPREDSFSPMTLQSRNFLVHTEVDSGSVPNSNVAKTTQITMNTRILQVHALHVEWYAIENLHIHTPK